MGFAHSHTKATVSVSAHQSNSSKASMTSFYPHRNLSFYCISTFGALVFPFLGILKFHDESLCGVAYLQPPPMGCGTSKPFKVPPTFIPHPNRSGNIPPPPYTASPNFAQTAPVPSERIITGNTQRLLSSPKPPKSEARPPPLRSDSASTRLGEVGIGDEAFENSNPGVRDMGGADHDETSPRRALSRVEHDGNLLHMLLRRY
jgi:hypothetical protein